MSPDFREGMIAQRLHSVRMILLVLSGKGGVGKSVVSATLAAIFEEAGFAVGLMDADIYGPSSALILGAHTRPIEGKSGLIPPAVRGVRIMSIDLFAPGRPVPLTGKGAIEVIREMLALTSWGNLDYLLIDMPPATADITMLLTSLRKRKLAAFVVTTPDRLSLAVAHRVMQLLHSGEVPVAGVLENMHRPYHRGGAGDDEGPTRLAEEFGAVFLGELPYDLGILSSAGSGDVRKLLKTKFAHALRKAVQGYLKASALQTGVSSKSPTSAALDQDAMHRSAFSSPHSQS